MTDAEKGILGSILTTPETINEVYTTISPEMFSTEIGQECYRCMCAMCDLGQTVNIVELNGMVENDRFDKSTINEVLKEAILFTPTSAYIKQYAKELTREYQSRSVKKLLGRISLLPKDISNTMGEIMNTLELLADKQETTCKSMKQIVAECRNKYFVEREENGVLTGFYKLDELLGHLEGGDITIIGARPAVGKSAFVMQMILQMASRGNRVGYFNLEMSDSQVFERAISNLAKIQLTRIRRAKKFLGDEEALFNKASDILSEFDVFVSSGGKSVSQIRKEARHMKFDVIIIDYLQLIKSDRHYANRASEVGDISKAIKSLAMELKIPIIVLSQLNRTSEHKETKEPTMAELRESGDIEQDASNIILLWNVSESNKSYKGLKIDKNRQGELGKIGLRFMGDNMRFDEQPEEFEQFIHKIKQFEKSAEELNSFCSYSDNPFE